MNNVRTFLRYFIRGEEFVVLGGKLPRAQTYAHLARVALAAFLAFTATTVHLVEGADPDHVLVTDPHWTIVGLLSVLKWGIIFYVAAAGWERLRFRAELHAFGQKMEADRLKAQADRETYERRLRKSEAPELFPTATARRHPAPAPIPDDLQPLAGLHPEAAKVVTGQWKPERDDVASGNVWPDDDEPD